MGHLGVTVSSARHMNRTDCQSRCKSRPKRDEANNMLANITGAFAKWYFEMHPFYDVLRRDRQIDSESVLMLDIKKIKARAESES